MEQRAGSEFTLSEVARHNKDGDAWVAIDGEVFDVTKFSELHPGGKHVLLQHAGKDASDVFHLYHNETVLRKYREKLAIGKLKDGQQMTPMKLPNTFGDMVAYGDPLWLV